MPFGSKILLADGRSVPKRKWSPATAVEPGQCLIFCRNKVSVSFSTGVKAVFRFLIAARRSVCVRTEHRLYGDHGWQRAAKFVWATSSACRLVIWP